MSFFLLIFATKIDSQVTPKYFHSPYSSLYPFFSSQLLWVPISKTSPLYLLKVTIHQQNPPWFQYFLWTFSAPCINTRTRSYVEHTTFLAAPLLFHRAFPVLGLKMIKVSSLLSFPHLTLPMTYKFPTMNTVLLDLKNINLLPGVSIDHHYLLIISSFSAVSLSLFLFQYSCR